jgi:hypothetical protein
MGDCRSARLCRLGPLSGHFHKPLDGRLEVRRTQMRVSLNHGERPPPPELRDRPEVHAGHDEPARERMP